MKSILAALLVFCVWSQAHGATKAKPPQRKPIPRAPLNKIAAEFDKIMAEFAIVPRFQTRPAVLSPALNRNLSSLSHLQSPALTAAPQLFLGRRYTLFGLTAVQPPKATYWQVGCGKFLLGRIHQGQNSFLTMTAGPGFAPCSYQQGKYMTWEPIEPGLSLGGTVGGGTSRVVNVPFASYTTTGFHHVFRDGFKVESIGKGTPQAGVGLTLTLRTN
jgi:hypothetical protein